MVFKVHALQGYLAHKKTPPPLEAHPRALRIGLPWGPRGRRFLMSEVPLHGLLECESQSGARALQVSGFSFRNSGMWASVGLNVNACAERKRSGFSVSGFGVWGFDF